MTAGPRRKSGKQADEFPEDSLKEVRLPPADPDEPQVRTTDKRTEDPAHPRADQPKTITQIWNTLLTCFPNTRFSMGSMRRPAPPLPRPRHHADRSAEVKNARAGATSGAGTEPQRARYREDDHIE